MLELIKVYAQMEWLLLPCHASGAKAKAPLIAGGFKKATSDWSQIEA